MYPARTRNLWLATSASAGASRRVGMKSFDQRCMRAMCLSSPGSSVAGVPELNRSRRDFPETGWARKGVLQSSILNGGRGAGVLRQRVKGEEFPCLVREREDAHFLYGVDREDGT